MDHVKSRQTSIKIRTSLNQDEDLCILPRNISDISQPVRSEDDGIDSDPYDTDEPITDLRGLLDIDPPDSEL